MKKLMQTAASWLSVLFFFSAAFGFGRLAAQIVEAPDSRILPASADGNWGLGFPEKGKTPVGNASAEYLSQYNACYTGDPEKPFIYLTFDAGYENGNTAAILDALQRHHAPAAFFLVGNYLETNPELVRRMVAEGHTVGNHTYHHPDMSAISTREAFEKELTDLEDLFLQTTGQTMSRFYRPPQGKYSESNLKMACELGYRTVFWSLAYVDWLEDKQPSREEAFDKLLSRIHPGAIVLLHSTSRTNAQILDELLTQWEDMGYRFGSLEDLITNSSSPKPAASSESKKGLPPEHWQTAKFRGWH